MAGSVNKAILVGRLGRDPEIKSFQNGGKVCNLSVATSESWKDKQTGEWKDRTEWHRVTVFNETMIGRAERTLKKGAIVYIEGQIETRKYQKNGSDAYTTEVVLRPYRGELHSLDSKNSGDGGSNDGGGYSQSGQGYREDYSQQSQGGRRPAGDPELDDEVPF